MTVFVQSPRLTALVAFLAVAVSADGNRLAMINGAHQVSVTGHDVLHCILTTPGTTRTAGQFFYCFLQCRRPLLNFIEMSLHLFNVVLSHNVVRGKALQGALFTGAHLENTTFLGTYLEGAFFHRVQLERTEFAAASLAGAKFSNCVLNKTDFQDANLQGAFFMKVEMHETNFENANLSGVRVSPDFLEPLNNTNIKQDQWSYDDGVLVPSAESNKPNLADHSKHIGK